MSGWCRTEADILRKEPRGGKVQVTEGTGLSNVKAVADKYRGDFTVSCDEEKFQAVVMRDDVINFMVISLQFIVTWCNHGLKYGYICR